MEKITWKSEKRKIEDLKPFEGNPRQEDSPNGERTI